MGVQNLWKLLQAAGRNIEIESLQGIRVAIDVSIWMIKLLHGMSNSGMNFENIHLIGMIRRIMFLLENNIKPVFVFDGPPPQLKQQTLKQRAQQRQQYNLNLQKLAEKYVVKLIEKGIDIIQPQQEQYEEILLNDIDDNDSQLPQEEQQILNQQDNQILNLEYQYLNGNINGFYDLDIQTKRQIIQNLIEENENYYDENNQNLQIKKFLMQAEHKEKIRNIRIEAIKQIETIRIEKILEQYNDKESQLIKEYLYKNEDLIIKIGQMGINNIYLYLQDEEKRKELVNKLYGEKKQNKRKLKGYELENQHLQNIREALRKRYKEKLQDDIQEEYIQEQEQEQSSYNLMDQYDCFDLDIIQQKMEEELREMEEGRLIKQLQQNLEGETSDKQLSQQYKVLQLSEIENEGQNDNLSKSSIENDQHMSDYQSINEDMSYNQSESNKEKIQQQINDHQKNRQSEEEKNKLQITFCESKKKDIQEYFRNTTVTSEEIQQQFLDLNPKQTEQKILSKNHILPTEQQLEQLFTQINEQDENINQYEMLDNIRRNQNIQSLDSTNMQKKYEEIRQLLTLFGIPWIMAPGEAEAQCAYLQQQGLVDCVITEDSDVFLFGATKVLKGFFERQAQLIYYDTQYIKQDLGLDRDQLIYLALFLGSDYTIGIKGVGIVNAMEIVEVFDNIQALQRFQQWASKADVLLHNSGQHYQNIPEKERIYKEQHKNYKKQWELPSNFPNIEVINGYKYPKVDQSLEQFQWGKPAQEKIIQFCENVLQFSQERINDTIKIPFQKLQEKTDQKKITDFFKITSKIAIINSKRINNVILNLNQPDQSRQNQQTKQKREIIKKIQKQQKHPEKRKNDNDEIEDIDAYIFKKQIKK